VITCLVALLVAADPEWKTESAPTGFTLESRPVKDSSFYEYRTRSDVDVSTGALCDAVFEWATKGKDHDHLKSRTVLEDHGDVRVVYDQIDPPVVSKRDYAITVKRTRGDDGNCRIDFSSSNDKAPKAGDDWVRIEKMKGWWTFEPREGGARITYQYFAEPGGSVPAMFVHGSQRESAIKTVQKGIAKARELSAKPPQPSAR
jgi:hypothetical protein